MVQIQILGNDVDGNTYELFPITKPIYSHVSHDLRPISNLNT